MIKLFKNELTMDHFAGGGGASSGMTEALGRKVDIAVNHDEKALNIHELNHKETEHYCESTRDVCPIETCGGKTIGFAWFSPDCTHHSNAKGGVPLNKNIRGLAWTCVRWGALVELKSFCLENVKEFMSWGPLLENGRPDKKRAGETFNAFVKVLTTGLDLTHPAVEEIKDAIPDVPLWKIQRGLGYTVEWKLLEAHHYGTPTIRKRLFMFAKKTPGPINWPKRTHGPGLLPYRTAAEVIDWNIPCPSIFTRKRPLAEKTLDRIRKGMFKYVIDNDTPFVAPDCHKIAFITECANGSSSRSMPADEPLRTVCASPKGGAFALVCAFIAKNYTGVVGADIRNPLGTVTTVDHNSLVTAYLVKFRNNCHSSDVLDPLSTITAGATHHGLVSAFLVQYYGTNNVSSCREPMRTVTTRDRIGLVQVYGVDYVIVDIGFRMLQPKELYLANGFPADYKFMCYTDGTKTTKKDQVRWCGNAVPPTLAKAMVSANVVSVNQNASKEALIH